MLQKIFRNSVKAIGMNQTRPGSPVNGYKFKYFRRGLFATALLLFTFLSFVSFAGEPTAKTGKDQHFMAQCLELARTSVAKGNEPFGAMLVKDGRVVMRAENTINTDKNITHHAETNLLAAVYRKLGHTGAHGTTLYTSCEPCAMCSGVIYLMGVSRVVYGLSSPHLSAMSGFEDTIRAKSVFALGNRKVNVTGHVLEDQAATIMENYLKKHKLSHHLTSPKTAIRRPGQK